MGAMLAPLSSPALDVTLNEPQVLTYLKESFTLSVAEPYEVDSYRCEWLRDGKVIPGKQGFTLEVSEAHAFHAGTYQARVIGAGGVSGLSRKTPVVIADPGESAEIMYVGAPITLAPRFWGPVNRVFWRNGRFYPRNEIIKDCWWARGAQTRRLEILVDYLLEGNVECVVVVGEDEFIVCSYQRKSYDYITPWVRPKIFSPPRDLDLQVGSEPEDLFLSTDQGTLTVSGLPPGLSLDGWTLYGTTTKAGRYKLDWKLLDHQGRVSDTAVSWIFVRDPENPALSIIPGLWAGEVSGTIQEAPVRAFASGIIEIQAAASGAFSGTLRLGKHRWPLAGVLRQDGETYRCRMALAPPPGLKRLVCVAHGYADYSSIFVLFETELADPNSVEGGEGWTLETDLRSPCRPDNGQVLRPPGLGRMSAILYGGEEESGFTLGHGFMSATPARGLQRVNVVGSVPDGSGFTGSMPVVAGQPFSIVFYSPLPRKGDDLICTLELLGMPWQLQDQPVLRGFMSWLRTPKPDEKWNAGTVKQTALDVFGEMYFLPKTGPLLPATVPGTETRIRLGGGSAFAELFSEDSISFDLLPNHRAVFPKGDPRSFKIDIYAPTGFFSGSFKLFEEGENKATKFQTVNFRGLMVPGLSRGGGFFHFKAPPSMMEEASGIYSGTLDIFRPDAR